MASSPPEGWGGGSHPLTNSGERRSRPEGQVGWYPGTQPLALGSGTGVLSPPPPTSRTKAGEAGRVATDRRVAEGILEAVSPAARKKAGGNQKGPASGLRPGGLG